MITFSIKSYFLWTPFSLIETKTNSYSVIESENGKLPPLELIDKKKQRRLNALSKLVLHSAIKCTTPEKRNYVTVLSSRNGEINNAVRILKDIADDELVSPQMFVNSVLNMPFAYYSIFFGNDFPSSAVASSESSLGYGFLEAVMNLKRFPECDVLLTCADLPLKGELEIYNKTSFLPYSLSIVISNDVSAENKIKFDFEEAKGERKPKKIPDAMEFHNRFLKQENETFVSETSDLFFTWKRQ